MKTGCRLMAMLVRHETLSIFYYDRDMLIYSNLINVEHVIKVYIHEHYITRQYEMDQLTLNFRSMQM